MNTILPVNFGPAGKRELIRWAKKAGESQSEFARKAVAERIERLKQEKSQGAAR